MSIREVRLNKGIRSKTISDLIGIKRITYYKKETGAVKFSLDEAKKIADFMGMPIEEVFFAETEIEEIEKGDDENVTEDARATNRRIC